jgi:hypothetical protein
MSARTRRPASSGPARSTSVAGHPRLHPDRRPLSMLRRGRGGAGISPGRVHPRWRRLRRRPVARPRGRPRPTRSPVTPSNCDQGPLGRGFVGRVQDDVPARPGSPADEGDGGRCMPDRELHLAGGPARASSWSTRAAMPTRGASRPARPAVPTPNHISGSSLASTATGTARRGRSSRRAGGAADPGTGTARRRAVEVVGDAFGLGDLGGDVDSVGHAPGPPRSGRLCLGGQLGGDLVEGTPRRSSSGRTGGIRRCDSRRPCRRPRSRPGLVGEARRTFSPTVSSLSSTSTRSPPRPESAADLVGVVDVAVGHRARSAPAPEPATVGTPRRSAR